MVYVTAVMNYAAQSEMLIYLLRSVRGLIEQKGYEGIDAAIKVWSGHPLAGWWVDVGVVCPVGHHGGEELPEGVER